MSGNAAEPSAHQRVGERPARTQALHATNCPMDAWVEVRLAAWGREFALERTISPGVSILWVLMRFGGVSPRGTGGRAPVRVDESAWQIERIVADMFQVRPIEASVLRAYYAGVGRQKVERRAQAERLARARISERDYFHARDRGVAWVMGALA